MCHTNLVTNGLAHYESLCSSVLLVSGRLWVRIPSGRQILCPILAACWIFIICQHEALCPKCLLRKITVNNICIFIGQLTAYEILFLISLCLLRYIYPGAQYRSGSVNIAVKHTDQSRVTLLVLLYSFLLPCVSLLILIALLLILTTPNLNLFIVYLHIHCKCIPIVCKHRISVKMYVIYL